MSAIELADRTLPHNLDAERAVLGAVLVHDGHYATATRAIGPEDFYRDAHRQIFDAMGAMKKSGCAIDLVTLTNELKRVGILDAVGGPSYVAALVDGVPRATNVEYYARIVREKARLRGVIYASNKALVDAYEGEDDAAAIVERAQKQLASHVRAPENGFLTANQVVLNYAKSVDDDTLRSKVYSGLVDLDAITRGFRAGDLVIVAARPSMGKTSLGLGICDHIARKHGPAPFFSVEMSEESLAPRILGLWAQIDTNRFEDKTSSARDYEHVGDALGYQHPLLLNFDVRTVTEMDAWCRKVVEDHGRVAAIGVDYLQLLTSDRLRRDSHEDVADVSRSLKRLAKDFKTVVIALSQLSRAPENRRDKRPQMSDLRGSGALEQDCDLAVLIYRDDAYNTDPNSPEAGIAELIVAKHRNGPTGVAKACFLKEQSRFANLAIAM